MGKRRTLVTFNFLPVILILTFVFSACAPAQSPVIQPVAPPASRPTSDVSSATPSTVVSPQEAAWNKVLETAKREGKVTVYSFNFTGDLGIAVARAFEDRYGIKVDIITGRGAEFIERLKTEKRVGQPVADVSEGSAVNVLNMKENGLTVAVPELPELQKKDVWVAHPLSTDSEAHLIGYFHSIWTPWVNTRLVKPEQEPKSFSDLLKPEWQGKMVTHDPNVSSSLYLYYVPLVNAGVVDWNYIQAVGKQKQILAPGPVQIGEALSRGEIPLAVTNGDSSMTSFVIAGAPVKAVSLKEGDVDQMNGGSVIIGPHPNAGRVFLNWLITEEGQTIYTKFKGISSIRKGLQDFRPVNSRAQYTRLVPSTAKDYADGARLQRERFIIELWKK